MSPTRGTLTRYKGTPQGRNRWRWRVTAANGRKLANGGEAYANEADLDKAIARTLAILAEALDRHADTSYSLSRA